MLIKYIENFLTPYECKSIIELGESINLFEMKSSYVVNGKTIVENVNYGGNKRMGNYIEKELLELPIIKTLTNKIIELSNELNPYKGITYNDISKYSFNKYSKGDFLDWHPDNHEIINGATITYIIQLNDEYEDGEVKYKINDIEYSIEKKEGSVFIFDSNLLHSVNKIKDGFRYSMNVWPSKTIRKTLI